LTILSEYYKVRYSRKSVRGFAHSLGNWSFHLWRENSEKSTAGNQHGCGDQGHGKGFHLDFGRRRDSRRDLGQRRQYRLGSLRPQQVPRRPLRRHESHSVARVRRPVDYHEVRILLSHRLRSCGRRRNDIWKITRRNSRRQKIQSSQLARRGGNDYV